MSGPKTFDQESEFPSAAPGDDRDVQPLEAALGRTNDGGLAGEQQSTGPLGGPASSRDEQGSTAQPSQAERITALQEARVVLVSACLLGEACRYDGRSQRSERVLAALADKNVIPVCPEVASGLPVPRPPVDLRGGTGVDVWAGRAVAVERAAGIDRTEAFQQGARLALEAARRFGATVALLKEKSPSCGSQRVYESGQLRAGEGITTALLRAKDITVLSDEDL
ncbi:DUF523 domain-containing protein [Myxococcus xanthus]|uniref:DUF523 domain-containing protein n=1 Tax=Myxococcus xanthus TaxID=34 RepID=UPI001F247FC2|nr:DUF523 domain-containing protein [Myxococcus xanthus]